MANKKDDYGARLSRLIAGSVGGDHSALAAFLASHSNLPGPRANLELLGAYSNALREASQGRTERLWKLSLRLRESPDEFVEMCGVRGIGAIGRANPRAFAERALSELRLSATHRNWRVREAVAMALQDMIESEPETAEHLHAWVRGEDWLEMRAVAAGVSEPRLLRDADVARSALRLHQAVFKRILSSGLPRSGEFRVLRQALAYSLSVVVAALPEEGFSCMEELIVKRDADVLWICRENLKKNRLASRYPQTKALMAMASH